MREFNSIQEKILDRTLYLIGQKGCSDVSIRDITAAAGVNVNAINYYFGNKEALIDRMEEFFIENYLAAYSVLVLEDDDMDDEQRLIAWANEIMEYTLRYPGIQVLLRDNISGNGRDGKMAKFLKEKSNEFNQKVNQLFARLFLVEGEELKLMRIAFDSAILYPASFGTTPYYDLSDISHKSFRLRYIKYVIQSIMKGKQNNEI